MTNYKPDLIVDVYSQSNGIKILTLNLKIAHIRAKAPNGRDLSPTGGTTVIFEQNSCSTFKAQCRHNENYSKKKGVLTAIQKLLLELPFRCLHNSNHPMNIQMFTQISNGRWNVYVGESCAKDYFWLD